MDVDSSVTEESVRAPGEHATFEDDCRESVRALQGALIELYAAVGADPSQPQDVARRFGLNKNLTWKVSRIVGAGEALAAVQHIPGSSGVEILLGAMGTGGAPELALQRVRGAARRFDDMVRVHAGDRAHLDLMLDSMGVSGSENPLQTSRQLAFQGNSGIWGVQARTRLTTGFIAPSLGDPSKLDVGLVGGFVGFRRLRPDVSWPLFRFQHYTDTGEIEKGPRREPIEETEPGGLPTVMRRFSSARLPAIRAVQSEGSTEYLLEPGPVGNLGAFDVFFGDVVRGLPRYRNAENANGEFSTAVLVPLETLVFDIIVHREVELPEPEVLVFGRVQGSATDNPAVRQSLPPLPLSERCVALVGGAGGAPVVATPLVPRYPELVRAVVGKMGYEASEFRGLRLVVQHPPMPCQVALRWELPNG